jgi:hypothetical protein
MNELAEELLQVEVTWESDTRGFLRCPGEHLHTTKTGPQDTVIHLDGVPTIYCFHEHCAEIISDANYILRDNLAPMTHEQREESEQKNRRYRQIARAAEIVSENLYRTEIFWPEIFDKPIGPNESFEMFLTIWSSDSLIWLGDVWDTGPIKGNGHFNSIDAWKRSMLNLYANRFTTASTFIPGTVDRIVSRVDTTPFKIVEFDSLSPDIATNRQLGAARLKYLANYLDLVMIVDSGNKSLHGWFRNNSKFDEEMAFFCKLLGADTKSMRPAQAVRLPGARRENGKVQSILWMSAE